MLKVVVYASARKYSSIARPSVSFFAEASVGHMRTPASRISLLISWLPYHNSVKPCHIRSKVVRSSTEHSIPARPSSLIGGRFHRITNGTGGMTYVPGLLELGCVQSQEYLPFGAFFYESMEGG